ncbi:HAMP domain-containing protein, partial [Gracilibacillus oryzae]
MNTKWFKGVRFKLLLTFTSSIVLSILCIIGLEQFLFQQIGLKENDIADMEKRYSFLYMILFFLLTTLFYYLSSKNIIKRIEDIDDSVNEVKKGNLDIQIQTSTNDEIG